MMRWLAVFFGLVVINADICIHHLCVLYSGISLKISGLGHNAASELV